MRGTTQKKTVQPVPRRQREGRGGKKSFDKDVSTIDSYRMETVVEEEEETGGLT
jgi:hypothetical protein